MQAELDDQETHLFAIRNTRDARALMERAEKHLDAKRWSEAILSLQELIESHRGDVLPARMEDDEGRLSTYAFHTGAGAWATAKLMELPDATREQYRQRYDKAAEAALSSAQASGDRRSLIEVAERWPLTDSAETALWTLGDLEFELGSLVDAENAWRRASAYSDSARKELGAGALERLRLAREWRESSDPDDAILIPTVGLRLTGSNEGRGPVPEESAEPWTYRLPRSPFRTKRLVNNIYPIYAEDQVFVSNSMQVVALDAYTGELNWQSEEQRGWDASKRANLVKGIDPRETMIAPAVSGSILIAPIQVPYSRLRYANFQGIRITTPIPERRLFAFDRTTGTPLWDHSPPIAWEGDTGSFAQNVSLAGPPATTGTRVIVPCYFMQGRVDFHVACYDISTGERLWSTQLISGQRGLNMFGRHEREFCAPPIRIEGDRAIVLTQLGTVAALDVYTGQILWQSLYEQIPLPRNSNFSSQRRTQHWRNTAPVVADDAVLVTPIDSEYMVAFDIEHGTALWSYPYSLFNEDSGRDSSSILDTMLGADDNTVFMGGGRIAAFHSPAGLAAMSTDSRLTPTWSFSVDPADGSRGSPRAILGRDSIVLSGRRGRVAIDKLTGAERQDGSVPWIQEKARESTVGNLFLGEGMLFTSNGEEVTGLFDWNILEVRAMHRIEEDPSDIAAILTLAQVREQHGEMLYQMGNARESIARLQEARELLIENLEHATHSKAVTARMHTILRTAALAHESLAETTVALGLLGDALTYAPGSDDVRDTLLQRESLLRGRDPLLWLETLDELERRCTAKSMPREAWAALIDEPAGETRLGITRFEFSDLERDLPVGLWVYLMRALSFHKVGDTIRELEELHSCLARYETYVLTPEVTTRALAREWIDGILENNGRQVYARFEERAQAMLELAVASVAGTDLSDSSGPPANVSVRDMELVRKHYPHSEAARTASDLLLDFAYAEGDADRVTRLVADSISDEIHPTEEDARRLLLMAEALGQAGNLDFQLGLTRAIAEDFPSLSTGSDSKGKTISDRLAELPVPLTLSELEESVTFEPNLFSNGPQQGQNFSIGMLPPGPQTDGPSPQLRHALLREAGGTVHLDIRPAATPAQTALIVRLLGMHDARHFRTALTSKLVVVSDGRKLMVRDAETGNLTWPSWKAPRGWRLNELAVSGGVLICLIESDKSDFRALAYDVHGGRELWQLNLKKSQTWRAPIIANGRAIFLTQSQTWQNDSEARVVDLYRGTTLSEIDLGIKLSADTCQSAFVRDGVLILAGFHMASLPERNLITAYDIERVQKLWSYELRDGRELEAMVQFEDATYVIVSPGDNGLGGSIMQLETRLGAVRPVMQLRLEDRILIPDRPRGAPVGPIQLRTPYLFFYSVFAGRTTTPLTAVHLPFGKRWVCSLRIPIDELYDVGMSFPSVSETTVAIAYTKKTANYLAGDTFLTLIDRDTGTKRGDYVLSRTLGNADDLELIGLKDALFIMSSNSHIRDQEYPMEIWESRR